MATRKEILEAASEISASRDATHGDFDENMRHTHRMIEATFGGNTDDKLAWQWPVAMAIAKLSRAIVGTPHPDHFIDAANYIAQAGEMALAQATFCSVCKSFIQDGQEYIHKGDEPLCQTCYYKEEDTEVCNHKYEAIARTAEFTTYCCVKCNHRYSATLQEKPHA